MSKKKKTDISINFSLKSFEILDYSFSGSEKDLDHENLGYLIQFKPDADLEKSTISIRFIITGQIGKKDPIKLGTIETLTTYDISDINELTTDEGNLLIPKGLAVTLLSIALSTSRGALVAKSEGNILSKEVLPLADPKELYESSPLKGEFEL